MVLLCFTVWYCAVVDYSVRYGAVVVYSVAWCCQLENQEMVTQSKPASDWTYFTTLITVLIFSTYSFCYGHVSFIIVFGGNY